MSSLGYTFMYLTFIGLGILALIIYFRFIRKHH